MRLSLSQRTYVSAMEEYQRARRCVHAAKSRMKDRHDGKGVSANLYAAGDLVWFNVKNIGLRHVSRRHKLLPKYWGPVKILDVVGRNTVRLELPSQLSRVHPVVSTQLIKPYKQRTGEPLPPVVINSELEFEVDDIIDFSIFKSRRKRERDIVEFRVKWKGSCEDTWHEPIDFEHCQDVLVSYLQRLTKSDRIKVLKAFDAQSFAWLPASIRSLIE
jgi:hypothetical protein